MLTEQVSVADLRKLKASLGISASGGKAELARKIADRVLAATAPSADPASAGYIALHTQDRASAKDESISGPSGASQLHTPRPPQDVQSDEFKGWFGDWEGNPADSSKVIDPRSGKPLVVYHGTKNAEIAGTHNGEVVWKPKFDVFDTTGKTEPGAYFSPDKQVAERYGVAIPYYLNARNLVQHEDPLTAKPSGADAVYRMRGKGNGLHEAFEIGVFHPDQISPVHPVSEAKPPANPAPVDSPSSPSASESAFDAGSVGQSLAAGVVSGELTDGVHLKAAAEKAAGRALSRLELDAVAKELGKADWNQLLNQTSGKQFKDWKGDLARRTPASPAPVGSADVPVERFRDAASALRDSFNDRAAAVTDSERERATQGIHRAADELSGMRSSRGTQKDIDRANALLERATSEVGWSGGRVVNAAKQPWQMTPEEFMTDRYPQIERMRRSEGTGGRDLPQRVTQALREHRELVQAALERGDSVPASTLERHGITPASGSFQSNPTWDNKNFSLSIDKGHLFWQHGQPIPSRASDRGDAGKAADFLRQHGGGEVSVTFQHHGDDRLKKRYADRVKKLAEQAGYVAGDPVTRVEQGHTFDGHTVVTLRKQTGTNADVGGTNPVVAPVGSPEWEARMAEATAREPHEMTAAEHAKTSPYVHYTDYEDEISKHGLRPGDGAFGPGTLYVAAHDDPNQDLWGMRGSGAIPISLKPGARIFRAESEADLQKLADIIGVKGWSDAERVLNGYNDEKAREYKKKLTDSGIDVIDNRHDRDEYTPAQVAILNPDVAVHHKDAVRAAIAAG